MTPEDIETHEISVDGTAYSVDHDPYTGDWAVVCLGDEYPQPVYLTSKTGAIEYILEKEGIKKYGGYRFAPDRTSA